MKRVRTEHNTDGSQWKYIRMKRLTTIQTKNWILWIISRANFVIIILNTKRQIFFSLCTFLFFVCRIVLERLVWLVLHYQLSTHKFIVFFSSFFSFFTFHRCCECVLFLCAVRMGLFALFFCSFSSSLFLCVYGTIYAFGRTVFLPTRPFIIDWLGVGLAKNSEGLMVYMYILHAYM